MSSHSYDEVLGLVAPELKARRDKFFADLAAKGQSDPNEVIRAAIYDAVVHALTSGAPGIGEPVRAAIARNAAMRALHSLTAA